MTTSTEDTENCNEEFNQLYGNRDGILFVIDATPSMFENDPNEGIPYFLCCVRQYKEIVKQRLTWNRQDWIGLIFFGINESDDNSAIENVLTAKKLSLVSVEHLKQAMKIDEEENWKRYQTVASSLSYPLYDVLWHAARMFSSINVTMPIRRVLLFTCQHDPPFTDKNEKHRIRVKASSYADIDLSLSVIGLGDCWNPEIFYKDLELLANKIDSEDYERLSFKDLLGEVKFSSRIMAKLPWKLGEGVDMDVTLQNISVKSMYLKKKCINREDNTQLNSHRYLTVPEEGTDEEDNNVPSPALEMDIEECQNYGDRTISFTRAEVRSLCAIAEPAIQTICVKPIFYHPLYHYNPPYFVIPSKTCRKDNKLLFSALLHKCDYRNQMIVCTVTIRKHSSPKLYTMIPNAKGGGGFYLYQILFKENMAIHFADNVYDEANNMPPIDRSGVFEKIMAKLSITYDPRMFFNPQLQMQLQIIETAALDLQSKEPPPDTTLPKWEEKYDEVKALLNKYDEIFSHNDPVPSKKTKTNTNDVNLEGIKELVLKKKLASYTVPQLKDVSRKLGLKQSGKKDELITRIEQVYK